MAYSKFTSIVKLSKQYQLQLQAKQDLFAIDTLQPFVVSQYLKRDLQMAETMPMATEKAKSEWIISPILRELKAVNPSIAIFSGFPLNIEGEQNLQGHPDYLLTVNPTDIEIIAPIFCLMESKNKTPEEGIAQCVAEMYAARLYNQQNECSHQTIYGAVTNAYDWIFLKLEQEKIYVDKKRYYLREVPIILSIFQFIINQYK